VSEQTPPQRRAEVTEHGQRRNLDRPPLPDPLPHPITDTHCHLDVADGRTDLPVRDAIRLAAQVNVDRIVQVGTDVPSSQWAADIAHAEPSVVAGVAIHPNDAARLAEHARGADRSGGSLDDALGQITDLARDDRVRAIGETGLDYFRTQSESGRQIQQRSFAAHIRLARELDKTLVVHDRDAHADILRMLDAQGWPDRVVMHCFSGDAEFARRCLDHGAYLAFGGTVTFKKSDELRNALATTPLDRVLTETDAPFLTPEPYRGRPNASYLIPHTAAVIANVLDRDLDPVCQALDANASAAFGGGWAHGTD
jgi:TatD DNase family protein